MKKALTLPLVVPLVLVCLLALLLSGCGRQSGFDFSTLEGSYDQSLAGTTLNVYNWGEYISDGSEGSLDVNAIFEELTGIKVNYTTFDSNEAMYAKLKSGAVSYDIIIPSDYMIERMISEGMLEKLDMSRVTNYHYIRDEYKDLFFDPNNEYSVPYLWNTTALIYNTTMVEGTPDSWSIMWDEKYAGNILTYNNSRDAFSIAQLLLGQDVNSTDKADWDLAAAKLKEQNPLLQGRVMDEIYNKMEGGNAAIAAHYSGDFLLMYEENQDLAWCYPDNRTVFFVDSVCIPSCVQNYDAAMLYINFLNEIPIATANADYIAYTSPHQGVRDNPDYYYKDNELLYPSAETMPEGDYFHDLPADIRSYYETLWEEVLQAD